MSLELEPPSSPSLATLERVRASVHPDCIVCSPQNSQGLNLTFQSFQEGQLVAEFACPKQLEGYPGRLQGGVVASLMDGIMTNCLFAYGIVAVTIELNVRYRHPVKSETVAVLCGEIAEEAHGLYLMKAKLEQEGQLQATATAKFYKPPDDLA